VEALKGATKGAESDFITLRARKRVEEQRLHDTVAHFIEGADNPISTSNPQSGTPRPDASGS
jgi:hypothetical protein